MREKREERMRGKKEKRTRTEYSTNGCTSTYISAPRYRFELRHIYIYISMLTSTPIPGKVKRSFNSGDAIVGREGSHMHSSE